MASLHYRNSKNEIETTTQNLKPFMIPKKKHTSSPTTSGIRTAMCPDTKLSIGADDISLVKKVNNSAPATTSNSIPSSLFNKFHPSKSPAADLLECRAGAAAGQNKMYHSSIPNGDTSFSPFREFTTTASESYIAHENLQRPVKNQYLKSNASDSEPLSHWSHMEPNYLTSCPIQSTASAAFVDHGRVVRANRIKPHPTLTGPINGEYPMCDNMTTNADVYRAPNEGFRRLEFATAPPVSSRSIFVGI